MSELYLFIIGVFSWTISLFLTWGISKFLKIKRSRFVYSFWVNFIVFLVGLVVSSIFLLIPLTFLAFFIRILVSIFVIVPLWFYLIKKIYHIPLRDALKMGGLFFSSSFVIYIVLFMPFTILLSHFGLETTSSLSCEERYSSFPLKYLPKEMNEKYLEICLSGDVLYVSDNTPDVDAGMDNFEMIDPRDEQSIKFFEKLSDNHFRVYKSRLRSLNGGVYAINLRSSVAFDERSENIYFNLNCVTEEGLFVSSVGNKTEIKDKSQKYSFESISQEGFDFKLMGGYAYLQCDETCTKEKVVFKVDVEKGVYSNRTNLAQMNTGELMGTELLYVEANKPTMIALGFVLDGKDSATMRCTVGVTSEKPLKTFEKSFSIEYIAD